MISCHFAGFLFRRSYRSGRLPSTIWRGFSFLTCCRRRLTCVWCSAFHRHLQSGCLCCWEFLDCERSTSTSNDGSSGGMWMRLGWKLSMFSSFGSFAFIGLLAWLCCLVKSLWITSQRSRVLAHGMSIIHFSRKIWQEDMFSACMRVSRNWWESATQSLWTNGKSSIKFTHIWRPLAVNLAS